MVSIILAASPDVEAAAKKAGFREEKILIRHNGCTSTETNKKRLEKELFEMKPYQFLVADFWGAALPD